MKIDPMKERKVFANLDCIVFRSVLACLPCKLFQMKAYLLCLCISYANQYPDSMSRCILSKISYYNLLVVGYTSVEIAILGTMAEPPPASRISDFERSCFLYPSRALGRAGWHSRKFFQLIQCLSLMNMLFVGQSCEHEDRKGRRLSVFIVFLSSCSMFFDTNN